MKPAALHCERQMLTAILCPPSVRTQQRQGAHGGGPDVSSEATCLHVCQPI